MKDFADNVTRREFIKTSAKVAGFAGLSALAGLSLSACNDNKGNDKSAGTSADSNANTKNLIIQSGGILSEYFTLSNGVKIPKLGLGLWRIEEAKVPAVIASAIQSGYRHFDSAQAYQNEKGTGEGVRNAIKNGLKREEIFVTTKVRAEHKSYESAKQSIEESLSKLGLDFIDLMLIHSPQPWSDFRGGNYFDGNAQAWRALEDAHKAGKIRAIGVSNFLQKDLENIFKNCTVKPMVNQVLCHIGNTPFELIKFCNAQGLVVEAYSPIAHGELLKDSRIVKMAEKYGVSAPQLCIAYTLQIGTVSLPKSANPAHIEANTQVDFAISAEDLDALKAMTFSDYGEHSYFPVFSGK